MTAPRLRFSCRDCGRRWNGYAEAHCTACCRHFTADSVADGHRVGPMDARTCVDPGTLHTRKGEPRYVEVLRAGGPTWSGRPKPAAVLERLAPGSTL